MEIKDYRKMKKKLKSIIIQFGLRLEDLQHREVTREYQEAHDKSEYEEAIKRTSDFMQQ